MLFEKCLVSTYVDLSLCVSGEGNKDWATQNGGRLEGSSLILGCHMEMVALVRAICTSHNASHLIRVLGRVSILIVIFQRALDWNF